MQKYKHTTYILKLLFVLIVTLLFTLIWYVFYRGNIIFPILHRGNIVIVLMYLFVSAIMLKLLGALNVGRAHVGGLIYNQVICLIVVNIFMYLLLGLINRNWVPINGIILLFALQIVLSVVWSNLATKVYFKIHPVQEMAFLYANYLDKTLLEKVSNHKKTYNIKQTIDVGQPFDKLLEEISKYDSVILANMNDDIKSALITACYAKNIRVYLSPNVANIITNGAERMFAFDAPLLYVQSAGLTVGQIVPKRLMDIALSLVGIALSSPIMLVVSILIKKQDGGPVLYKQERLTLGGRVFELYKFRTMKVDAEADGIARLSSKDDVRVTAVGKKLRRYRLDELPQLINVLRGELSLVGPRPERPSLAEEYTSQFPEFAFRLKVKAGLTGNAQVYGRYSTRPEDKLMLDLIYIENYSFFLDLKLILQSIRIIFEPNSSN